MIKRYCDFCGEIAEERHRSVLTIRTNIGSHIYSDDERINLKPDTITGAIIHHDLLAVDICSKCENEAYDYLKKVSSIYSVKDFINKLRESK